MNFRMLFVLSFCCLLPSQGFAIDFGVGIDSPPIPLSSVTNFDTLQVVSNSSESYCCGMFHPLSSTNGNFSGLVNFEAVSPAPFARGSQIPVVSYGGGNATNRRYCWYEAESVNGGPFTASRGFTFGNISSPISPYVSCEETTLYGNYNTSVTEFNFLELTARSAIVSGETLSGVITLISSINGQRRSQNFSVSFESLNTKYTRLDIAIHDLLQNQRDFGAVIIKHNGAPGQLSARTSYYDVTSTSPLDFTLVGQADLKRGSR